MSDNQWGEDADPVEDMKRAMTRMKEPTLISYYQERSKIEQDVQTAIELLTKEGKTPQEIEKILIKYGIW